MSIRFKAKTAVIIFAVLLMASVMFIAVQVQPVVAQLAAVQPYIGPLKTGDVPDVTTNTRAGLSFRPTIIGVGQSLLVNFWINPALASNNVIIPDGGYIITITKPDGKQDVFKMRSEPATAANYFEYVPDVVGNWTIKFEFLGAYFPAGQYYDGNIVTTTSGVYYSVSTYYKPSSTGEQALTVQEELVWSWPLSPLPEDYWTRPVSLNNRGWWPGLGSWPGTGYNGFGYSNWAALYPDTPRQGYPGADFTPWVTAPNSAHVLWKRKDTIAGLIGGPAGQYGTTGSPNTPNLIYAGRCYDTRTIFLDSTQSFVSCAVCTDLRTGEYYYQLPGGITPQYVAYIRPEASGETIAGAEIGDVNWAVELLSISGGRLYKINPNTGAVTGNYSLSPLTGGTFHNQINGYFLQIQDLGSAAGAERYRLINWTSRGTSSTLAGRIISNTTYQRSALPLSYDFETDLGATVTDFFHAGIRNVTGEPFGIIRWWVNCCFYRFSTGELLYNITTDTYPDVLYQDGDTITFYNGKCAAWTQGGYWIIFDGRTGHYIRSEGTDYPWSDLGGFGAYSSSSGYGMLFRYAYDGVYAFNWTDGKLIWHYKAETPVSFESPYIDNGTEVYSFNSGGQIADGKLYVANSEHTTTYPITRGWSLHCINITTGERIWKLNNPMTVSAIADGYAVCSNSWDGTMYVIGRGKSATTVTAPDVAVPKGTSVVIKGSVLDMSPAQPGTPCVSQASMEQQMEYLHLSQPIGGIFNNETITGVPVSLTAISSDGSFIDLGTATTNGYSGEFGFTWTPENEGTYEIIATFAADESYGSSMSTTTLAVGPAPEPYPAPIEPEAPVDNSILLYAILVLVVIAIIIGIAALLRKR